MAAFGMMLQQSTQTNTDTALAYAATPDHGANLPAHQLSKGFKTRSLCLLWLFNFLFPPEPPPHIICSGCAISGSDGAGRLGVLPSQALITAEGKHTGQAGSWGGGEEEVGSTGNVFPGGMECLWLRYAAHPGGSRMWG